MIYVALQCLKKSLPKVGLSLHLINIYWVYFKFKAIKSDKVEKIFPFVSLQIECH